MALTLRLVKGAALTYQELDDNFIYLSSSLTTGITAALTTASVSSNTITFTKGDASQFSITVDTGSGGGGGTPGGSDTQIQFNSNNNFAGDSALTYNYTAQSFQQGQGTVAYGAYSHAEGYEAETFGTGSHAEGFQTSTAGDYSHAEGFSNQAVGAGSHAEGEDTVSFGIHSHAEGKSTVASGSNSHAEGYVTLASGLYSHAEGESTQAIGIASHAEGSGSVAIGRASHAAGWNTVASGSYQHVQGQFNISSSVQSAFILGNGTSTSNRSNLIFAAGNTVGITGSLNVTGSLTVNGVSITGTGTTTPTSYIATGSVTASVNTTGSIFTVASSSVNLLTVSGSGVLVVASSASLAFGRSVQIIPSTDGGSISAFSLLLEGASGLRLRTTSNNSINFNTNNLDRWYIEPTGQLTTATDNIHDIGLSGSRRPRNIYAAGTGSVFAALDITSGSTNALKTFSSTGNTFLGSTPVDGGFKLDVNGTTRLQNTLTVSAGGAIITGSLNVITTTPSSILLDSAGSSNFRVGFGATDFLYVSHNTIYGGVGGGRSFTIASSNNFLIGTTTDSGFKLDVSGSGRFTDGLTVTGSATSVSGSASGSFITNIGDTFTSTAAVTKIVSLTLAEYNALTKDSNTLYIVV